MNIYDFFNSPDVADYCQSIGHTLNAVEAAVMVENSNTHTFFEKLAAFRTIIAEYPDMELPKSNHHDYHKSFHKALGNLIVYKKCVYEKFMAIEPNTVYQAQFEEMWDDSREVFTDDRGIYSCYEKALADAVEHAKKNYSPESMELYDSWRMSQTLLNIRIKKKYIDSIDEWGGTVYIYVDISENGEIMDVGYHSYIKIPGENGVDFLLLHVYIDIPVPFKHGDLVEIDGFTQQGNVFVLTSICRDNVSNNARDLYKADRDDMIASIHYEMDGMVMCEVTHFYPDLKYCRRELKGEQQILKYLSLFMQDKLCVCTLMRVQKILMLEKLYSEGKEACHLEGELAEIGDELLFPT